MNISQKTIKEIPNYLETILIDKDNLFYQEQIRVKEYSNKIPVMSGSRKAVIPWSGGLDSTASLLMAFESGLEVITININYGQSYYDKELFHIKNLISSIRKLYGSLWNQHIEVDISWLDKRLKNELTGEWKHIFPFRNYIILEEAAKHCDQEFSEIWFSCVQGEIPYSGGDKSAVFLASMKELVGKKNLQLVLPLVALNKTDILNWSMEDIDSRFDIIKNTISCFDGDGIDHCGKCQSCFNRAVAIFNSGVMKDCGLKIDKVMMKEWTDLYQEKLTKYDHYSPIRRKQLIKFIKYVESL